MNSDVEIVKESDAMKRILNVLQEADVDDLARMYSDVVLSEGVCVVSDDFTHESFAEVVELDHPISNVYQDGRCLGYMDEKGRFQAFQDRFVSAEEVTVGDTKMYAIRDVKTNELCCVVPLERVQLVLRSLNEVGCYY